MILKAGHMAEPECDGWVEVDENGHLFIEVFEDAIWALNLTEGQYVRITVMDEHLRKRLGYDG